MKLEYRVFETNGTQTKFKTTNPVPDGHWESLVRGDISLRYFTDDKVLIYNSSNNFPKNQTAEDYLQKCGIKLEKPLTGMVIISDIKLIN
tara:strand:- start:336 stop:605 length:270 start_codon:yes stop_codon:yes gene_type:complete